MLALLVGAPGVCAAYLLTGEWALALLIGAIATIGAVIADEA